MEKRAQAEKAENFLALHNDPELLILPNIWDPIGARLLQHLGYPAVATASAAVAYSMGYEDGQRIRFDAMLDVIHGVAASVDLPVSADIERGYAEQPRDVAENIRRVIRAGAVGINIEDSIVEGGSMRTVVAQSERIRAIRAVAKEEGVPLVVNARVDVFLRKGDETAEARLPEAIDRARAYVAAGADCVYPITLSQPELVRRFCDEVDAPVNVYAMPGLPPLATLRDLGVARLSFGPGLIKKSLTAMREALVDLRSGGSIDDFLDGVMTGTEVSELVSRDPMP